MNMDARYEWQDLQAQVSQRVKGFLDQPDQEKLDAAIAQMRAYADAAHRGMIDIPQRWISTA